MFTMDNRNAYDCLNDLNIEDGVISGYVIGEDNYVKFIRNLRALGYEYVTRRSFSKYNEPARLFFHLDMGNFRIPFLGSPFQVIKGCEMECLLGPVRPGRTKKKQRKTLIEGLDDHPLPNNDKFSALQPTKIGCPAKFCVKCIRIYTDYKIAEFKKGGRQQHKLMTKIKDDMLDPLKQWAFEDRFYVTISADRVHSHPITFSNSVILNGDEVHQNKKVSLSEDMSDGPSLLAIAITEDQNTPEPSENTRQEITPKPSSSAIIQNDNIPQNYISPISVKNYGKEATSSSLEVKMSKKRRGRSSLVSIENSEKESISNPSTLVEVKAKTKRRSRHSCVSSTNSEQGMTPTALVMEINDDKNQSSHISPVPSEINRLETKLNLEVKISEQWTSQNTAISIENSAPEYISNVLSSVSLEKKNRIQNHTSPVQNEISKKEVVPNLVDVKSKRSRRSNYSPVAIEGVGKETTYPSTSLVEVKVRRKQRHNDSPLVTENSALKTSPCHLSSVEIVTEGKQTISSSPVSTDININKTIPNIPTLAEITIMKRQRTHNSLLSSMSIEKEITPIGASLEEIKAKKKRNSRITPVSSETKSQSNPRLRKGFITNKKHNSEYAAVSSENSVIEAVTNFELSEEEEEANKPQNGIFPEIVDKSGEESSLSVVKVKGKRKRNHGSHVLTGNSGKEVVANLALSVVVQENNESNSNISPLSSGNSRLKTNVNPGFMEEAKAMNNHKMHITPGYSESSREEISNQTLPVNIEVKDKLKCDINEQLTLLSEIINTTTDDTKMETLFNGLRKLVEDCKESANGLENSVSFQRLKRKQSQQSIKKIPRLEGENEST